MRKKDELAIDKILECAKKEFMKKGFKGASMRSISEKTGYTTGMIYGRFADKNELFRELVNKPSKQLYDYFVNAQNEFAQYEPNKQYNEMHDYVGDKIDCNSLENNWDQETGYIDLSNNLAERTEKTFVIARKNFMFCKISDGADVIGKLF